MSRKTADPRIFFKPGSLANEPDRTLVDAGRPTCMIEELVGYVWEENIHKDEPIEGNDHSCDAARYACRFVDANLTPGAFAGPYHVTPAEPLLPAYMGGGYGSATGW